VAWAFSRCGWSAACGWFRGRAKCWSRLKNPHEMLVSIQKPGGNAGRGHPRGRAPGARPDSPNHPHIPAKPPKTQHPVVGTCTDPKMLYCSPYAGRSQERSAASFRPPGQAAWRRRGNPVRIRDCPAAVSGNDGRGDALDRRSGKQRPGRRDFGAKALRPQARESEDLPAGPGTVPGSGPPARGKLGRRRAPRHRGHAMAAAPPEPRRRPSPATSAVSRRSDEETRS
jgi:hypothetical protein